MRPTRRLALASLISLVGGCGSDAVSSTDDGGTTPQPDLAKVTTHTGAELSACESQLSAAWQSSPPVVGLGPSLSAGSYQQIVGKILRDYQVPGGTVAVTRNGKLVMAMGIGLSDVDDLQPIHPDQLLRIASLSKQVTAAAVMRLVAEGKLGLDDKAFPLIADLAPLPGKSIDPALANVTVRNLLNHTGGWNRDFEKWGDPMFQSVAITAALQKPGPASCEDTIRWMLDKKPTYAPGSTYCYSNFGYCVLGRILERKSGKGYEDYVRSSLLDPSGAKRTRLGRTLLKDRADDEVRYYGYPGEPMANSIFPQMLGQVPWEYGGWAIEAMDAHGGWITSVVEMLATQLRSDGLPNPPDLFDAAALARLYGNPGVPSCTAQGTTVDTDPAYWYGFGWSVNKYGNHWHTGALSGTATFDATLANGYSWAAFFNSRPSDDGFYGRLDGDLWNAWTPVDKAAGFSSEDFFDQYAAGFGQWKDSSAFNAEWARLASGDYPVRLEGRTQSGATQYRAAWARPHASMKVDAQLDADCLDYRAKDTSLTASGYRPVSIQSFVDSDGHRRFQASWARYNFVQPDAASALPASLGDGVGAATTTTTWPPGRGPAA